MKDGERIHIIVKKYLEDRGDEALLKQFGTMMTKEGEGTPTLVKNTNADEAPQDANAVTLLPRTTRHRPSSGPDRIHRREFTAAVFSART